MAQVPKHLREGSVSSLAYVDRNPIRGFYATIRRTLELEGLDVAYVLQHSYETDGCEETKFIGVYRSREGANIAMERLRPTPGFRDHPNGFSIDEYRLDEDHWAEGFVSD
jgi:hypothetical protein